MSFDILIYIDMSHSHAIVSVSIRVLMCVYVYKYSVRVQNHCLRRGFPTPIFDPPLSFFHQVLSL